LPSRPPGVLSVDGSGRDGIVGETDVSRSMPASYARRRYFVRFLFVIRPIFKLILVLLADPLPSVNIQMADGPQACVKPDAHDIKDVSSFPATSTVRRDRAMLDCVRHEVEARAPLTAGRRGGVGPEPRWGATEDE
jgi:hypothetical protein